MNKRKLLKYAINLFTLIGLGIAAARYLNGEEVITALSTFNYSYLPFVLALSATYLFSKAYRFLLMMRPVSELPGGTFIRGYVAGAAASLVPGGVSIRAGLMKQAGVPVANSAPSVAFSSILDQVVFMVGSLLAALFYPEIRPVALAILGVVIVLTAISWIPAVKSWVNGAFIKLAQRFKFHEHWKNFLSAWKEVFTWRIMLVSFAISIAALLVVVYAFQLSLLGFGINVSFPILLLAYIVPTFLGRMAGTPGGVGVTEAGMVGFLTSAAGVDPEPALAAAAIFRISTVLFQALLGALVYFFFWRGEKEQVSLSKEGVERES